MYATVEYKRVWFGSGLKEGLIIKDEGANEMKLYECANCGFEIRDRDLRERLGKDFQEPIPDKTQVNVGTGAPCLKCGHTLWWVKTR